jgi:methylenetetrahydrofolate--tRNA-(uracil-5-)-methyltransferase
MAAGLTLGHLLGARLNNKELPPPPRESALGALYYFIQNGSPLSKRFDPANINFSLFPEPPSGVKKAERRQAIVERARISLKIWAEKLTALLNAAK